MSYDCKDQNWQDVVLVFSEQFGKGSENYPEIYKPENSEENYEDRIVYVK